MNIETTLRRECLKETKRLGSMRQVALATGVSGVTLHRFVSAGMGPKVATVEALFDYFGYRLVKKKGGRKNP